ncbi:hypothetical protein BKG83_17525 [Mycobacteroides chelonae]|uniref:Uncharacterized protein n=2 Tax=Mycobacteroides chelonae TaxID=1774 RepID=A0A1S1LYD5_MYCCH|nr:hypothetical protein [Mycobacteroides chelonae]OHU55975.1 hypothetical protein BKG83_17525 [Mycobacteroides chelonae]OHU75940.1 hypothetical protein BKG84_25545 [Mycobacteroides chelonae]
MSANECRRDGCISPAHARGLCANHHKQWVHRLRAYGRFASERCPIEAPIERVRQLRAVGVGLRQLQELTGLPRVTFAKLEKPGRQWVSRRTYELIMGIPAAPAYVLASPEAFIDSTGTTRRLRALARVGYGGPQITEMLGIDDRGRFCDLYSGRAKHIKAGRAMEVAVLFKRLELTEGPSRIARDRAIKKGWPLPLQWDEDTIDDPAAKPIEGSNYSPFKERLEELHDMGIRDVNEIAERLDQKPESVKRQLERIKAASNKDSAA